MTINSKAPWTLARLLAILSRQVRAILGHELGISRIVHDSFTQSLRRVHDDYRNEWPSVSTCVLIIGQPLVTLGLAVEETKCLMSETQSLLRRKDACTWQML